METKKIIRCPCCGVEIDIDLSNGRCVEDNTSFFYESNQEELAEALCQKGYEFGVRKCGDS